MLNDVRNAARKKKRQEITKIWTEGTDIDTSPEKRGFLSLCI
jgi:hypothetical protein